MASTSAIIQYLRGCYEADNRETGISNLLHKSIRHRWFLSGDEHLLSGLLSRVPVQRDNAIATKKEAELYRREKSLLYCAFPIISCAPSGLGKPGATICAPLLFYPARLTALRRELLEGELRFTDVDPEDETAEYYLEIEAAQQRVNMPVLAALLAEGSTSESMLEEFVREFPEPPLDQSQVQSLISLLQDFVPRVDAFSLTRFPRLEDE